MSNTLIIVGAGGHGQAIADLAESTGEYEKIYFVDDCFPERNKALGIDIVGKTDSLFTGELEFDAVFVAIGNNRVRQAIIERIIDAGLSLASLIHPKSWVSDYAEISVGVAVMAGAVVGTNARLKVGALVNANATVDHDCILHKFAHIGAGVQLAGGVEVASSCWMQAGSCAGYFVKTDEGVVYSPGTKLIKE